MQESEGPNAAVYKAFQKDTLQEVLLTYFRILKLEDNTKLIHVVLEGLAKFGALLNSRIITDLLEILKDIMTTNELPIESTIQCVLASLRLMQVGRLFGWRSLNGMNFHRGFEYTLFLVIITSDECYLKYRLITEWIDCFICY